jgi:MinD-like ATPase involved in chromosome partitioning or flagellar assembly
MTPTRVATVAGHLDLEATFATRLMARSDVELVIRCLDRVELLAAIRGGGLDALVVVGHASWFDRQCAIEAANAEVTIVTVGDGPSALGTTAQLGTDADINAVVDACNRKAPAPVLEIEDAVPGRRGRVTTVWGPKGSPGRTRISIELAFELAATGSSTLLVDADPYGGDVLQTLGIVEEVPTVVWAARLAARGELLPEEVSHSLRRVGGGPVIMPGIPRADLWADVSDFGFGELLQDVRGMFDHIVCDIGFCLEASSTPDETSHGRNRMARAALAEADRAIAICRADSIGIKNFLWAVDEVRTLVHADRLVIVANRVVAGEEREIGELLRRHAGRRPVSYIPEKSEEMIAALRAGSVLRSSKNCADFQAAIQALAISVGARLRPRGVMTRLAGKRS